MIILQPHLVVCPSEDTVIENLSNTQNLKFSVIQKKHTFEAFRSLEESNQFRTLTGHNKGEIMCYVINPGQSPSLVHYGNIRAHTISSSFKSKPHPQDMLHIYCTLLEKQGETYAIEVVDRMAKLCKFRIEEITAIKKLCKWSLDGLSKLNEVLRLFEFYQTLGES